MDWALWRPRDETLTSIKELLQDALIPDSEIQKDVQTKLKNLEIVEDFTYYLLYIVGQTHFSEEIRSLSGILLKNNIASVYSKLPQDSIIKMRHLCLMLLRDPCRDVRTSISNVIYALAKHNISTWPELIPFLVKSFETHDEYGEVALTTLFSVCEELMNLEKSEEEICTVTKEVFPKFVDFLADEKCEKKQNIIKLINQFLQDHYKVMKHTIDLGKYLRCVIHLADTDDVDMQKYICHTFVMYIEYREECLLPHLHDVIMYLMVKTQHEDHEVALGACEFWLAVTKLSNCKDILAPYIDKLLPVLLKNMKYSTFELIALKDTLRVDDQSDDLTKETFPFHMHDKRITRETDYENEDGDYLGNCDDVDDFYVGWTLRKCSAASLDAIAVKFGEDILPLIVPFFNELLYHQDFLIKESAILALGAISEGCMNGLKPHLSYLIEYLIHTMNDDHSMVRVITCWTLSRYVSWIINSQSSHSVYFIPVMTILLKHFMDDNKRVQRAAISAFCVFQEEAQMQLIPYIDLILEGFQLGFQKFNYRSLYLLYDAINVLALSVGNELGKPEHIDKLMPPIMQKLSEYNNYSDDQFIAVLECLANIIPSLDAGFLPYSEVVYLQCMEIIMDTYMADANFQENLNGFDPPDKEPMHVALDVLYSMAVGLKSYFYKYVTNSNLVCLLYTAMQDCSFLIRQSSIALYGELVLICYPYLSNNVGDYIKLIIKNLDECYEGVCKNAAWVIGKLTTVMGMEIRPHISEILSAFINILRNPSVSRAMHQTVSVSLCTLCCIYPDITISDCDTVLKNCCLSLRSLKDSDEKDLAFRGLCHVVVRHPEFCQNNFMYFCDAVASWNNVKSDLKDIIKNILISFKEQCGEINWIQFYAQFPELLKLQLYNLKCPQSLIAPLIQIIIDETRKSCKKQPIACGFNPMDNAYEPLKLMQTVMAITNEVCLRYLDNSMLCSLPSPGTSTYNIVSVCAAKNKRRRMEDRHVVIPDLNIMFNCQECTPSSYYAIFDGHAGHDAAAYSAAHLHQFLAENSQFVTNPEQALLDAFCKTDALFIEKCNVERFNSGTTAVCALLRPKEKKLYIAWVGDSQALLVNQGRVLQCVNPHKPCRADERERIEKQGGYVCYWGTWRVNGQLAVSRAIGDAEYKPYVIAVPDIRLIPLDGGEDFLILACDGLWDFLSEDDAARAVYEMVCQNPDETDRISEQLVYLSKERGSADNISVIVIFLREPSKIAAEAHWANRNASPITMDTSLDNANNPFANSNGADNNIIGQKSDGLLLNLSENFKHNGSESSPTGDFYHNSEKSNGKRSASEFDDDDDLGPETDVDATDDILSPSITAAKALADGIVNNNPEGRFNPFVEKIEVNEAAFDVDFDLQKQQSSEFDGQRSPREETPTPPADAVHDGGLEENIGDSGEESEDEWNYIKGEEANKENISPSQPDREVADILEDEENMSQLNPNAAEFVPVSPTRSIPSPACRLKNDAVIAQSPKRPCEIDISLPNPQEFQKEIKSRPSDVDSFSNGHDHKDDQKPLAQDLMENLLNGKNIDEIPEFQPGSTPSKTSVCEEFHFGPNAAPFTPVKLLDQSEAALSTKAVFGDESNAILDSSSETPEDNVDFPTKLRDDPMNMSFYQDKNSGDADPFDLNKVQVLPEDVEDFLCKPDETIEIEQESANNNLFSNDIILNNDERVQTTDLDKIDNEKELASPVSNEDESIAACELSNSSEPQADDFVDRFENDLPKETLPDVCLRPQSKSPQPVTDDLQAEFLQPEVLSPEPTLLPASQFESESEQIPSPEGSATVLNSQPELEICGLSSKEFDSFSSSEPQPALSKTEILTPEYTFQSQDVCEISKTPVLDTVFSEPVGEVCMTHVSEPEKIDTSEPLSNLTNISEESRVDDPVEAEPPINLTIATEENRVMDSPVEAEPPNNLTTTTEENRLLIDSPVEAESPNNLPIRTEENTVLIDSPVEAEPPNNLTITTEESRVLIDSPVEAEPSNNLTITTEENRVLIDSPVEDITSSVKDVSSPISSPVADQDQNVQLILTQEINTADVVSSSSPVPEDNTAPEVCILSTPKSVTDTESVATTDVNSFLERSQIADLASPLSPIDSTVLNDTLLKCVYPLPTEIETENIIPEFAESVVISPTEPAVDNIPSEATIENTPAVVENIPSVPSPQEETVKEPEIVEQVAPIAAAVAATAGLAATAAAVSSEKKPAKAKTPTASKKPITKATPTPTKPTPSPSKVKAAAPTAKAKPLAPTAKTTSTARANTGSTTTKLLVPKPAPKPKLPTTTAAKPSADKKPVANGDVKTLGKGNLLQRKSTDGAAKSTTSTLNKASPTKPPISRPTTASTRTATKPTTTTVAPKPRPTTLVNKTGVNSTVSRTLTTTVSKSSTTKAATAATATTASKTSTPPKPRPTSAPTKPKVPATKTASKPTADAAKQNKDSANKLTASRTVTSSRLSGTLSSRTVTSTVRKTEVKATGATRTAITKSTTTTTRPGAATKKSLEAVSNGTKTGKSTTEKLVQNGVTTVVTEVNTIVNDSLNDVEAALLKDNSPIDNKLLVDTTTAD